MGRALLMGEATATGLAEPGLDQTERVYAAEDAALAGLGRRFGRWAELVAYVDAVVASPHWETFTGAPMEVHVDRRSTSATASLACRPLASIAIRDGSWDAPTVLHELAHLAAPRDDGHGPSFASAFAALVREHLGFPAYGALASAYRRFGVVTDGPR